jgi:hypothetical protein
MPSDCSGPVIDQHGFLKAIDCQHCGYAHLDPLPMQDELDALYRDEYYQKHNAGWFEKEQREQWYWRKVYDARLDYAGGAAGAVVLAEGVRCTAGLRRELDELARVRGLWRGLWLDGQGSERPMLVCAGIRTESFCADLGRRTAGHLSIA